MKSGSFIRFITRLFFVLLVLSCISCYHYRVLTTNSNPGTEYKTKVIYSYLWGLINKPQEFHVDNCTDNNSLDEVVISKKFGQSLLTVFTLGIVSPVEVKWKCHTPAVRPDNGGL